MIRGRVAVVMRVNGEEYHADVEPRTLLVHLLRDKLGLRGTKVGCDTTSCGACTVLLDGRSVKSCTILAVQADNRNVTTIEGLSQVGGTGGMHPMQEAFHRKHASQCGYCTPGMVMAAISLTQETGGALDDTAVRRGLKGNLCRCTGYQNIIAAVLEGAPATVCALQDRSSDSVRPADPPSQRGG